MYFLPGNHGRLSYRKARIRQWACVLLLSVTGGTASAATEDGDFRLFPPGSPVAPVVHLVDVRAEPPDTKLAVVTLQGLVNAGPSAEVYLYQKHWDRFWLNVLHEKGYVSESSLRTLSVEDLFRKYADRYEKLIIYDPAIDAGTNVATMLASVEKGVVAGAADAARFGSGKEVVDLRGRWKSNVEAYEWAFEHLWPRMNHRILASFCGRRCHNLRDYLVANRIFTFWVTGPGGDSLPGADSGAEEAFAVRLFESAPANIPVIGFWTAGEDVDDGLQEYKGVGLAGRYGKLTVVSDLVTNGSFLSGVRVDIDKAVADYLARRAKERPTLDPRKIYICFNQTESGDAPTYLQFARYSRWQNDPKRGRMPINWCLGPSTLDFLPPLAEWVYDHATANDYIFASLSGAAYVHPYRDFQANTPDPEAAWREYLALTRSYMRRMRCPTLSLYTEAGKPFDRVRFDPITRRFADAIPELRTLVMGMTRDTGIDATNANYMLGERPVLVSHILTRWRGANEVAPGESEVQWLAREIQRFTPHERPAFMQVMALSWKFRASDIVAVREILAEEYVPVSIPDLDCLFRKHLRDREGASQP